MGRKLKKAQREGQIAISAWRVTSYGFPQGAVIYAASRGKALANAWRCDTFNHLSFKEFLKRSSAKRETPPHDRFGEEIEVCGKPAYLVSLNRQYIQFVRPGSDVIINAHPLDVNPPVARRGTPYYEPAGRAALEAEKQK